MTPLQRYRARATLAQNNLCYYCRWPMWNGEVASLPAFKQTYGLTKRQAKRLLCTAEHLIPRSKNGGETAANIVAACEACNTRRAHRHAHLSVDEYRALVEKRVDKGEWHSASFRNVIGRRPEQVRAASTGVTPAPKTNGHAHAAV